MSSCELGEYHSPGKERDADSGNDYFGARYYGSTMGRFLSPDPDNDSAFSHPGDPQAWNGSAYGRNNPLANIDPGGDDYYLLGGNQCGQNGVSCDNSGYVLGSDGNRQVVTDAQTQNGGAILSQGANGGVNVTIGTGTFAGEFFDASPNAVSAVVPAEDPISGFSQSVIAQTNAYNQAAMPLLNSTAIDGWCGHSYVAWSIEYRGLGISDTEVRCPESQEHERHVKG